MRGMNQRVVVIVIVGLFALCFVGSLAAGSLALVGVARDAVTSADWSRPEPEPAPEPVDSSEPSEAAEPTDSPDSTTVTPPTDPDDTAEVPEEYAAPLLAEAEFAIFHVSAAKVSPWKALQKVTKGSKLKIFDGEAPVSAIPPYLVLRDVPVEEFGVITGDAIEQGRGLTAAVKKALPATQRATIITATLPPRDGSLLQVSKVMAALAQATGGVLWDEDAQEYLAIDAWKTRRVDSWEKSFPDVSMHITVYFDATPDGVDLKTAGLKHFGFPELELTRVPAASQDAGVELVSVIAQLLVEGTITPQPGLYPVRLAAMKHKGHRGAEAARCVAGAGKETDVILVGSHDGKSPVLQITFPGKGTPADRVETALINFFGSKE